MFCKAYPAPAHVTKGTVPKGYSSTCCKSEARKAQILIMSSSNTLLRGIHNSEVHRNNDKYDIDK